MPAVIPVLSILLGAANVFQFLVSITTGSSIRARAQTSFNDWYRVAQLTDQIVKEPQRAIELVQRIGGIADAARNEVKAYSREKLDFVPWYEPAYESGSNPLPSLSLWEKIKFAFVPK
jgi:hypothetical protein